MKAIWRGRLIAESDAAREVGGYWYFPRACARMDLLQATIKTPRDLQCPHGVQFYDLVEGAERSPRAAWSYEAPQAARQQVDRWIGFWEDVTISEE